MSASETEGRWPRLAPPAAPDDLVSVLMSETMAREFEQRCLGGNTVGHTELAPLLLFSPNDLPTYIISTAKRPEAPNCGCRNDCRYASRTGRLPDGVVCRDGRR